MSAPWMPLYVADYLADTGHLSAAEHGAYLMLIMHYWRQGSLPIDDGHLQRIAKMTPGEWRRSRGTIAAFFQEGWKHGRIDAELAKSSEKSARRAASGSRGGEAKAANAKSLKSQDAHLANATILPEQKPSKPLASSSHSQSEKKESISSLRSDMAPRDEDAELFRRGREVLGRNCGGQIAKLKSAYDGSIAKARAVIENASTKDQPAEYVAKILGNTNGNHARAGPSERSDSNAVGQRILAELRASREQNSRPSPDWNGPEIFTAAAALPSR